MPGIVIFKMDLWPIVKRKFKPEWLDIENINVEVTFPSDPKLKAAFRSDPLLYQQLQDKIKPYMTEHVVKNLGNVVRKLDAQAVDAAKIDDVKGLLRSLEKFHETAHGYARAASTMAAKHANKIWMDFCKTRVEYTKYKVVAGCKITAGAVGMVVGAGVTAGSTIFGLVTAPAATVAAPATWIGITTGILGTLKSLVEIGKEVTALKRTADDLQKKIQKALIKLRASYEGTVAIQHKRTGQVEILKVGKKLSKVEVGTYELVGESLRSFFKVGYTTISETGRMNDRFHSKVKGLDVKSHKMSKDLDKTLNDVQKLKKLNPKKKKAEVAKLEREIHKAIKDIIAMVEKVKGMYGTHKIFDEVLVKLKARKPDGLFILEKIIDRIPDVVLGAFDPTDRILTCVTLAVDLGIDKADEEAAKVIRSKYRVRKM